MSVDGLVEWFHVNLGDRCEHGRMQGRLEVRTPCENWAEQLIRHLRAVAADEGIRLCQCSHCKTARKDFLNALSEPLTAPRSDGRAVPGVVGPDDEEKSL